MSDFPHADWLAIFNTPRTQEDDGTLTRREIMDMMGWMDWTADKEIRRAIADGRLEWTKSRRACIGCMQMVVAYRPKKERNI